MPATPNSAPNKLLGLEALRFLAAFAVLIWHYAHFAYVADKPVDLVKDQLPLHDVLLPFYRAGEYGVWVFWCISGFIFFWKYRDAISDRSMRGWTFFVYRLSRLYPLHFVTLLIVALLQPIYFRLHGYFFVYQANDLSHFLLQIFMASDWVAQNGNSFNGPIWSISVEVLVYLAFFLMLRFVTRSPWLNVLVIAVCLNLNSQVAACLAFFYAGGLAAMARQSLTSMRLTATIERRLVHRPCCSRFDMAVRMAVTDRRLAAAAVVHAHSAVLPDLQDRAAGAARKAAGGSRQHDLFELPAAFPDPASDRARLCDVRTPNSVL